MNRSAFSLIELIFVMIILGILSSVVVSKIGHMSETAKETQLKSFVGSLNRSVGPALWFQSINNNYGGSVAFEIYDTEIEKYTEVLSDYTSGPSFVNCNAIGNGVLFSYTFGNAYEIHCTDGIPTASPVFRLYNLTDNIYID